MVRELVRDSIVAPLVADGQRAEQRRCEACVPHHLSQFFLLLPLPRNDPLHLNVLVVGHLLEVLVCIGQDHQLLVEGSLADGVHVDLLDLGSDLIVLPLVVFRLRLRLLDSLLRPVHLRLVKLLFLHEPPHSVSLLLRLRIVEGGFISLFPSIRKLLLLGLQLDLPYLVCKLQF